MTLPVGEDTRRRKMLWVEAGLRDQISEIESDRAGQTENMIGFID